MNNFQRPPYFQPPPVPNSMQQQFATSGVPNQQQQFHQQFQPPPSQMQRFNGPPPPNSGFGIPPPIMNGLPPNSMQPPSGQFPLPQRPPMSSSSSTSSFPNHPSGSLQSSSAFTPIQSPMMMGHQQFQAPPPPPQPPSQFRQPPPHMPPVSSNGHHQQFSSMPPLQPPMMPSSTGPPLVNGVGGGSSSSQPQYGAPPPVGPPQPPPSHQMMNQQQPNHHQDPRYAPSYQPPQQQPGAPPFGAIPSQQYEKRSTNLLQERNILPPTPIEPPKPRLPPIFEHKDVNCGPDIFRCTVTAIPQTQELQKKARLPLGLVIHPFKDMKQLSVLQSSVIVRCRSCRTYINPFVQFTDQRHWKCNICGRTNDLPEEFHFDPATKTYGEPSRRPEIKNATVEFIAPSEYMVRPPQPSAYIFILDVSMAAVESGYLDELCSRMINCIDHIPGDHRTLIGFMAVDSQIHYFLLRDGATPKELIVNDIEDSFLPWNHELLAHLQEKKDTIKQFLQQLPSIYGNSKDVDCALGAALTAAHSILADVGGRITVFQASLANVGPGALTSREDPNLRAAKEIAHMGPASDFYKKLSLEACSHQVAMDLFLLSSTYADVATLSEMAKFCGGSIHYYPSLHAVRNPCELERFSEDVERYLTRKIGWESVLRIRCTKGLSLHTFHGNFFVRSTDLLALANVNPDAAFGVQVQMDDNLHDHNTVAFQAALLYTSSRGERRIRVHTMCLPVTNSLSEIQQGADVQTVISMLAKMAVDRSIASNIADAREALVNSCVDALGSYAASFAASQRVGALLAPESLKLFPLYILGLLKHPAFSYGTSIKLDHRVFAMNSFKTLPHYYMMLQIYPNLYPLHLLDDENTQLPLLQLSYEKVDRHGAYLMDTGTYLYLYIAQAISETFCREVLDVVTFAHIDEDVDRLPELNNPRSAAIRGFIDGIRSRRPFCSPLRIIREDSPSREIFVQRLVEDRSESTFSYVEFLQHLHKELGSK